MLLSTLSSWLEGNTLKYQNHTNSYNALFNNKNTEILLPPKPYDLVAKYGALFPTPEKYASDSRFEFEWCLSFLNETPNQYVPLLN